MSIYVDIIIIYQSLYYIIVRDEFVLAEKILLKFSPLAFGAPAMLALL
jgi:hypothetical protein